MLVKNNALLKCKILIYFFIFALYMSLFQFVIFKRKHILIKSFLILIESITDCRLIKFEKMSLLPGISQLKSIVQLATGDVNGALKTQEDFFQTCPVVSQVTGCVQLITGNEEAAGETFKKGLDTINSIANSIPVVGHLKAAVHLACDDEERANEALKSSNRTSG